MSSRLKRYPRWPWVKASDEAKRRGQNRQSFEAWLHDLDETCGGGLLMKRSEARNAHLWVNVRILEAVGGPTAEKRDAEMNELRGQIEELEIEARAAKAFRKRAEAWFARNRVALSSNK